MFIDTIIVGFPEYLTDDFVSGWPRQSKQYGLETYTTMIKTSDDKPITVTYHPKNMAGKRSPILLFQLSLPRMVSKCNHDMSYDLFQAIDEANSIIPYFLPFRELKIENGRLVRLDLCYQHDVGDLVPDYINILSRSDYSRRQTEPYKDCGVQYPSTEETAKFYDKFRQCHHFEAQGYLRQEITIRGSDHIRELLGNKSPILSNIDKSFAQRILERDLVRLRLDGKLICNRGREVEILTNRYGSTKASSLIGYMHYRESYSREQLISRNIFTPQAIAYRERQIADAGIAIQTCEKVELPPLSINL
jgi:hypothetical protein